MNFEDLRPVINKSTLTLYRIFALVSLYVVLLGVLGFGLLVGFYAVSRTWIAPAILSSVDKESLDLTSRLLATQGTVQTLRLEEENLEKTLAEAQAHRAALEELRPAINAAIAREKQHNRQVGAQLAGLHQQKLSDVGRTHDLLDGLATMDGLIDKELAAGLITKTDAAQARLQLAKSHGDMTDSHIAATLLTDNILEKTTSSTTYIETLDKKVELESQIATLTITIETTQKQIAADKDQLGHLDSALATARQTPFWAAMERGKVDLALVPYENQGAVVEGSRVYDCYLSFVLCREVGTLKTKFIGEQHAVHPIFRTDMRGFLVQLELTHPESAKSKTLFVGGKPLFF